MQTSAWRTWVWEYGMPTTFLLASLVVMGVIWDDPGGWWLIAVGPVVAFLTGVAFRPTHVWVTPVVVTFLLAVAIFGSGALGILDYDPPVRAWVLGTLAVGVGGVIVPDTLMIWAGKMIGMLASDVYDEMTS